MTKTMKLSDYIFQFIAAQGAKHVFMFPGGGAMHLVDSLGRCKGIEYICNLHEQACAIAAEAYARVNNNLGVALVTTGPGGTNSITMPQLNRGGTTRKVGRSENILISQT
jgi:acetolactate synthase-1/2/3 large subunit